jgi:hypothetical protein
MAARTADRIGGVSSTALGSGRPIPAEMIAFAASHVPGVPSAASSDLRRCCASSLVSRVFESTIIRGPYPTSKGVLNLGLERPRSGSACLAPACSWVGSPVDLSGSSQLLHDHEPFAFDHHATHPSRVMAWPGAQTKYVGCCPDALIIGYFKANNLEAVQPPALARKRHSDAVQLGPCRSSLDPLLRCTEPRLILRDPPSMSTEVASSMFVPEVTPDRRGSPAPPAAGFPPTLLSGAPAESAAPTKPRP